VGLPVGGDDGLEVVEEEEVYLNVIVVGSRRVFLPHRLDRTHADINLVADRCHLVQSHQFQRHQSIL
jgi:hypothetical protein